MSENFYNRFIDAFKDENETIINEKHSPLVSDEKLEDTFKILQNTIKDNIKNLKSTNDEKEIKSSRFQRWIIHYLKAPFKKWEKKIDNQQVNSNVEQENTELNSSSDVDDDDDEYSTFTEKIKQRLEIVKDFGEDIKSKVCFMSKMLYHFQRFLLDIFFKR